MIKHQRSYLVNYNKLISLNKNYQNINKIKNQHIL
jgi:hypothetical protein